VVENYSDGGGGAIGSCCSGRTPCSKRRLFDFSSPKRADSCAAERIQTLTRTNGSFAYVPRKVRRSGKHFGFQQHDTEVLARLPEEWKKKELGTGPGSRCRSKNGEVYRRAEKQLAGHGRRRRKARRVFEKARTIHNHSHRDRFAMGFNQSLRGYSVPTTASRFHDDL